MLFISPSCSISFLLFKLEISIDEDEDWRRSFLLFVVVVNISPSIMFIHCTKKASSISRTIITLIDDELKLFVSSTSFHFHMVLNFVID